jgi:hypothetical protein
MSAVVLTWAATAIPASCSGPIQGSGSPNETDTRPGCAAIVAANRSGRSSITHAMSPTPNGSSDSAGTAHCSVRNSALVAPLTPIIPRPPPSETARASAPPATPAIGAPMIGVVRSNQRVSGVLITRSSCRRPGLAAQCVSPGPFRHEGDARPISSPVAPIPMCPTRAIGRQPITSRDRRAT